MESKILCIETSTNVCSVAIAHSGSLLAQVTSPNDFDHAQNLTNSIIEVLTLAKVDKSELNAIALSAGPGSYTGLRIGTSVAKGLCFGLDIPLIALDSVRVLADAATQAADGDIIIASIDARRNDAYTSIVLGDGTILAPTAFTTITKEFLEDYINRKVWLVGNASHKLAPFLPHATLVSAQSSAVYMCKNAHSSWIENKYVNHLNFSPYYFKDPNITKAKSNIC